jgi:hypothetical protein
MRYPKDGGFLMLVKKGGIIAETIIHRFFLRLC